MVAVVDVVGARPIGQASSAAGNSNVTVAASAKADGERAVIATIGMAMRVA